MVFIPFYVALFTTLRETTTIFLTFLWVIVGIIIIFQLSRPLNYQPMVVRCTYWKYKHIIYINLIVEINKYKERRERESRLEIAQIMENIESSLSLNIYS